MMFEKSGYYLISDCSKRLIFDTGDICPSFLPAHGHCDALSFELYIHNLPYIVNSGTYMYEDGVWRNYFRSTKAHNTISIREKEQSQFWGSFRIAKRISKTARRHFIYKNIKFYSGKYTSFSGDTHKRYIGNISDNAIVVLDCISAIKNSIVKSYLHFYPGSDVRVEKNTIFININNTLLKISCINTSNVSEEQGWYSEQFI